MNTAPYIAFNFLQCRKRSIYLYTQHTNKIKPCKISFIAESVTIFPCFSTTFFTKIASIKGWVTTVSSRETANLSIAAFNPKLMKRNLSLAAPVSGCATPDLCWITPYSNGLTPNLSWVTLISSCTIFNPNRTTSIQKPIKFNTGSPELIPNRAIPDTSSMIPDTSLMTPNTRGMAFNLYLMIRHPNCATLNTSFTTRNTGWVTRHTSWAPLNTGCATRNPCLMAGILYLTVQNSGITLYSRVLECSGFGFRVLRFMLRGGKQFSIIRFPKIPPSEVGEASYIKQFSIIRFPKIPPSEVGETSYIKQFSIIRFPKIPPLEGWGGFKNHKSQINQLCPILFLHPMMPLTFG